LQIWQTASFAVNKTASQNRLDALSETPIAPEKDISNTLATPESLLFSIPAPWHQPGKPVPVKYWDVYVYDFIGMVQGNPGHHQHVKNILLSSLDKVFRQLEN
jgi:hypothetical protein